MTILWTESFEAYGTGTTGINNALKGAWANFNTLSYITTTNYRTGSKCLMLNNYDSVEGARRSFGGPKTNPVGIGFGFYIGGLPSTYHNICRFWRDSSGTYVRVDVTSSGVIRVKTSDTEDSIKASSSSSVITAGNFHHIEIEVYPDTTTSGRVIVAVDGVEVIDVTGFATTTTGELASIEFRGHDTNPHYFDDIFAREGAGFIGDKRVLTLFPNGDTAQADWSGSYTDIDDAEPDDDTTYIQASDSTPVVSEFDLENLPSGYSFISAVEVVGYMKRSEGGSATVNLSVNSNGTYAAGVSHAITTSYAYYNSVIELDPDTASSWLDSAFDAAKLRINRSA